MVGVLGMAVLPFGMCAEWSGIVQFPADHDDNRFVAPEAVAPVGESFAALRRGNPGARQLPPRRTLAADKRQRMRLLRSLPLLAASLAALAFFAMTSGGKLSRPVQPVLAYVDRGLEQLGLGISEIAITGQRMTPDRAIYQQLDLGGTRSLWLMDTMAAQRRIETLPWIKQATIKRVFPDRLQIAVTERTPVAVWLDGSGRRQLIDGTGRVLGSPLDDKHRHLTLFFGNGAAKTAATILAAVKRLPDLAGRVRVFEWVAQRRWTLHLVSGQTIHLPETAWHLALQRLVSGSPAGKLVDADFHVLDMRLAGRVTILGGSNRGRPNG